MIKNKLFRLCLLTGILVFIMALSCFASATYDEGSYTPTTNFVTVHTSYANTEWLGMVETLVYDNGSIKSICFFSVNMNVLQYLQNNDFVNGNQTATAYLDFWNIGSIQSMITSDTFITNLDNVSFQLIAIGEYIKQGNTIAELNNEITQLEQDVSNALSSSDRYYNLWQVALNDVDSLNSQLEFSLQENQSLTNKNTTLQNNYYNLLSNYNSLNNAYDELSLENEVLENRINELQNIIDRGTYTEGFDNGYNQALDDYEIFKSGFVTVLSSPMYVLNTIFGFELFGFNFFTVIQFILSVFLVVWLFKKMR